MCQDPHHVLQVHGLLHEGQPPESPVVWHNIAAVFAADHIGSQETRLLTRVRIFQNEKLFAFDPVVKQLWRPSPSKVNKCITINTHTNKIFYLSNMCLLCTVYLWQLFLYIYFLWTFWWPVAVYNKNNCLVMYKFSKFWLPHEKACNSIQAFFGLPPLLQNPMQRYWVKPYLHNNSIVNLQIV